MDAFNNIIKFIDTLQVSNYLECGSVDRPVDLYVCLFFNKPFQKCDMADY